MKQILLISRCPPYPVHLGDRLIIWHLARELSRKGWVIDLLAFAERPEDWQEQAHYAPFFREITLLPAPQRSPITYAQRLLMPAKRFPQQAGQSWSPAMWEAIEAQQARYPYDVVHLFGGIQVYEYAGALRQGPAIITPYESYSLYLRRALENGGGPAVALQRWIAQRYESWMFTPYAQTVVVSDKDRDELLSLNPGLPVRVIPNGVQLEEFQPQGRQRDPATLLFVGNYEYPPNIDAARVLAERILPAVQREIPNAKLQLVGNAPPPALQALASDSVEVTGRVPDVRPYLAQATAFVSPLRLGAGIKNKVLEALAMGTPVIASPVSVDGIAVTETGAALVAQENDFSQTVIQLLQQPALQAKLAEAGPRLVAERYSWAGVAEQYAALYRANGA